MLKTYTAVMLGGAIGTGCRMWLSGFIANKCGETFPLGTVVVNITGCFLIGLFFTLTAPDGVLVAPPLLRQFVTIGLLGGYTTFSSFSLQTMNLINDGEWVRGSLNVLLSVFLCLGAVWLGSVLAAAVNQRH